MTQEFIERHVAQGTMSYPPIDAIMNNPNTQHASVYVCDGAECQEAASEWVRSVTGQPGSFHPFPVSRPKDPFAGIEEAHP